MRAMLAAVLLAGMLAAIPAVGEAGQAQVQVEDAWSRPMPSGGSGVGYLSIRNDGDADDRLVAVEADRAGRVELHRTTVEDGVMRMRPATEGIELPAGQTVELEPGGLHLMFLEVAEPFAAGERIEAVLQFETGGEVPVRFVVGAGPADGDDHEHHDHEH